MLSTEANLKERDELRHDAVNKVGEMMERFNDRPRVGNLRLTERYRQGRIQVLCNFGVRNVAPYYVACFQVQRFQEIGNKNLSGDGLTAVVKFNEHLRHHVVGENEGCSRQQEPVLVGVVQLMEHPEIVPLTSLVRLDNVTELLSKVVDGGGSGGGGFGLESVDELNSGNYFWQELGAV